MTAAMEGAAMAFYGTSQVRRHDNGAYRKKSWRWQPAIDVFPMAAPWRDGTALR